MPAPLPRRLACVALASVDRLLLHTTHRTEVNIQHSTATKVIQRHITICIYAICIYTICIYACVKERETTPTATATSTH